MEFQTLRQGDSGEQVKRLQHVLKSMGYNIPNADGEFGRMTKNAVRAFQNDRGISVTGVVHNETQILIERFGREQKPMKQEHKTVPAPPMAASPIETEPAPAPSITEPVAFPENTNLEWSPWAGDALPREPVRYTPWEYAPQEPTPAVPYIPYEKETTEPYTEEPWMRSDQTEEANQMNIHREFEDRKWEHSETAPRDWIAETPSWMETPESEPWRALDDPQILPIMPVTPTGSREPVGTDCCRETPADHSDTRPVPDRLPAPHMPPANKSGIGNTVRISAHEQGFMYADEAFPEKHRSGAADWTGAPVISEETSVLDTPAASRTSIQAFQNIDEPLGLSGQFKSSDVLPVRGVSSNPSVWSGNRNTYVAQLQSRLKSLGYYTGMVTGFFGNATKQAVLDFQRANGMEENGIVDPKMWEMLDVIPTRDRNHPTLRFGDRGSEVSYLQAALQQLGYYKNDIDGIFGKNTDAALIAFQKDNNLVADGIAGKETWRILTIMLEF